MATGSFDCVDNRHVRLPWQSFVPRAVIYVKFYQFTNNVCAPFPFLADRPTASLAREAARRAGRPLRATTRPALHKPCPCCRWPGPWPPTAATGTAAVQSRDRLAPARCRDRLRAVALKCRPSPASPPAPRPHPSASASGPNPAPGYPRPAARPAQQKAERLSADCYLLVCSSLFHPIDRVLLCAAHAGFYPPAQAHQPTGIGHSALLRHPAAQVEGHHPGHDAIRRYPFAIEFAPDVHVRAGGQAALAGGVADRVAGLDDGARGDALSVGDVKIEDDPAGAFKAIPIQIEHHAIVVAAHHHTVGHRACPTVRLGAAEHAGRGDVERPPRGAIAPNRVRTASEVQVSP